MPPCTSCDCDPAFCPPGGGGGGGESESEKKEPNFVLQAEAYFYPGERTYYGTSTERCRHNNQWCDWGYVVNRKYSFGDGWWFTLRDTNGTAEHIDKPIQVEIKYDLLIGEGGCITNVTGYRGQMSVSQTFLNITSFTDGGSIPSSGDDLALNAFVQRYNWSPDQCVNPDLVSKQDFWATGVECMIHYSGKYKLQIVNKGNIACTLK